MNKAIQIFFAGDFCSRPSTQQLAVEDSLHALIHGCDLSVCNFERPLKPDNGNRSESFNHDEVPDFLQKLGFNLFSLGNNHVFDHGEAGFLKTKEAFGNSTFGSGTYEEALQIKIIEIKGRKIGFMALCYAARNGVFDNVRCTDGLGCAYINDLQVNHRIIEAKKKLDYLFVLPHDGIEYTDAPLPETMARYHDFIDYGADGVIASHPHCPQGWETYREKPIFYSLGNFFFNSKDDPKAYCNRAHWYEGLGVRLTLDDTGIRSEVFNIRNQNNMLLSLDSSAERVAHNQKLCDYLSNPTDYNQYLDNLVKELARRKEYAYLEASYHKKALWLTLRSSIKKGFAMITGRTQHSTQHLIELFKDDTRRNAFLRELHQYEK